MVDHVIILNDAGTAVCRKPVSTLVTSSGGGGGLSAVHHNQTLTGDGTTASPLGAVPAVLAQAIAGTNLTYNSGTGKLDAPAGGGGSGIASVAHDASLSGAGTSASPLAVVSANLAQALAGSNLTFNASTGKIDAPAGSSGGAASTVSASAPTGASQTAEGSLWHTTSATSAPYAKNSTYARISGQWQHISGWAVAEASVGFTASFASSAGSTPINVGSLSINTLNASSSAASITIPSSGVYDVSFQINPGSTCTNNGSNAQFGYGVRIFANGSEVFSNFTPLNALNTAGYASGTWGASIQCANTAFFNAGTAISFEVYASNCVVTGGCNAHIALRSRGGL